MGTNFFDFKEQTTPRRKPKAVKPLAAAPDPSGAGPVDALTISQLTSQIDRVLRTGFPGSLLVKGEISNYRPNAASGHAYFTMKDAGACVNCVMWKSDASRLRFTPSDGMELLARGQVQVYAQQGRYQLYVSSLQPLGQGALEIAFQQMKAKLEAEGLFDSARKRPLPKYPSRIVLMTSSQTAALQDMLKVLRRFPWVKLFVYHVPVQGDGCGQRIAAGLNHLGRQLASIGGADAVILSRGGGSLEDLWGFNEEAVARAVANCPIPVITGIGHEVDTSIADLVADYHAHTPTEAAQVVTAQWRGVREVVDMAAVRVTRSVRIALQQGRQRLVSCERHEVFRRPLYRVLALRQLIDDRQRALAMVMSDRLAACHRRVEALASALQHTPPAVLLLRQRERLNALEQTLVHLATRRLRRDHDLLAMLQARLGERHPRNTVKFAVHRLQTIEHRLQQDTTTLVQRDRQRLESLARNLIAVSPEEVLRRGYSITTRKRDGAIVRAPDDVKSGDTIVTRVADGRIESVVEDGKQPKLFE